MEAFGWLLWQLSHNQSLYMMYMSVLVPTMQIYNPYPFGGEGGGYIKLLYYCELCYDAERIVLCCTMVSVSKVHVGTCIVCV